MSDSNQEQSSSAPSSLVSDSGVSLVPAELSDFFSGGEIFIRGRKATCLRFDYPHVYWKFPETPEDVEKHRSFTASPQVFAVDPAYRAARPERSAGADDESEPPLPPPSEDSENFVS